MKKVFVTGVAGQLGHDVVNELTCRTESGRSSYTCVGSDWRRTTAEHGRYRCHTDSICLFRHHGF